MYELVQGLNHIAALAVSETRQIHIHLLEESLVEFIAQTGDSTRAATARLVAEHHSAQGSVMQVVLKKISCTPRCGRGCYVCSEQTYSADAIYRGTKCRIYFAIINQAAHLRHLLVGATQGIELLYLFHVDEGGDSTILLRLHLGFKETRKCRVGGENMQQGKHLVRTVSRLRAFLIGTRILVILLHLYLIFRTVVAVGTFYHQSQLTLVVGTFGHLNGLLSAQFEPLSAGVLEFSTADVGTPDRELHREEHRMHVFTCRRKQQTWCLKAASEMWHLDRAS